MFPEENDVYLGSYAAEEYDDFLARSLKTLSKGGYSNTEAKDVLYWITVFMDHRLPAGSYIAYGENSPWTEKTSLCIEVDLFSTKCVDDQISLARKKFQETMDFLFGVSSVADLESTSDYCYQTVKEA